MTPLRKRRLEYMQLKHYSASTIKAYIRQVVLFSAYLGKSPAQASLGEVVRYPLHLINDKRASQSYVNAAYSAIKALLAGVLGREWDKSLLPPRRHAHPHPAVGAASHPAYPDGGGALRLKNGFSLENLALGFARLAFNAYLNRRFGSGRRCRML